ncbi:MAG: zinc ribbon domain-containing protein [Myxococcota bacterium]|nr:zinc ribbon domain-containing protein [Myxococcota bacterium]
MSACTRCATALEDGDLRCSICALPVPAPRMIGDGPVRAQILRCVDCGAAVAFSAAAQAPHCAFCGAVMKIEQPVDPVENAQLRIPFTVDREAAMASLRGWLGRRGFFAPKTLRDDAVLESLQPLCWAGWIVNATAAVAWSADSDAGAQRSAWAPHAGEVAMEFRDIVVPASRGLDASECRLLVPYYDLQPAVPIDRAFDGPGELESLPTIESFDAQRSAARKQVQESIELTAKVRVEEHIPGRRFRNVHVACLLERQTTDRVALPAWVMAYRYRDRPYRAIVHGQRAEVVFGSAPKDWTKIMLVVLGGLAILAVIVAVILAATGR